MSLDRRQALQQLGLLGTTALLGQQVTAADAVGWKLSTFQLDVTPPVGHPLLGISFSPSTTLLDPLEARGFVLTGPEPALVVISIDWCEVRNDAFHRWRDVLAAAAGTTPERVLVHTVHQHDAPYFDLTAQKLLDASKPGGRMLDPSFHEDCVQRAAMALRASLANRIPVTHIGVGQAKIEKLASSRRVDENGKVSFRRYSRCTDPVLQALPDGQIDPWLKTISFWNDSKPLLGLSVYACHPMSYYGGGEISGDFPNMARKLRDTSEPRLFQIYASGCCGDVTAGKYNDGSKGNRPLFAERLAGGMARAWADTRRHPLKSIRFRNEQMILPHSELPAMSEAVLQEKLNNPAFPIGTRAQIALGLSNLKQHADGHHIDVPMIDFGPAQLILLPAESFVAYQLFAQEQRPDSFVVTLGFGESAPGYIPTNQAYKEGFREEHGYTWNRPGAEDVIQLTLKKLLLG
ncbi:MAG: hypothetical protein JSS49_13395 [Planctomycetes bacterium]|nr:hypothetical protein [Planctomycetota bacterium]